VSQIKLALHADCMLICRSCMPLACHRPPNRHEPDRKPLDCGLIRAQSTAAAQASRHAGERVRGSCAWLRAYQPSTEISALCSSVHTESGVPSGLLQDRGSQQCEVTRRCVSVPSLDNADGK
jgi:hypothetical protein